MNEHLPGSKIAERMFARAQGATMAEIIAATGGPQYNVLKRLEARGHKVRKIREGRETRYFVKPPANAATEISVSPKGQLTLPKELREQLGVTRGGTLRVGMEEDGRAFVARAPLRITRLAGVLGKAKRHVSLKEMDEIIAQAAVARYLRAVGKKK